MTDSNVNSALRLRDKPICQVFVEKIRSGEYGYLFDEFSAIVLDTTEEYDTPIGRSCLLVIAVGRMQIRFDSNERDGDPRGIPQRVAPIEAGPPATSTDWIPPGLLAMFIENRWSQFYPKDIHDKESGTPEARKQELITLMEYFSTDEYWHRKDEFLIWEKENHEQYMRQIYAHRKASMGDNS